MKQLTLKELAATLPPGASGRPRSRGYVHAMKRAGFKMPDKKSSLDAALRWLKRHPKFSWSTVYNTRKMKKLRRAKHFGPWEPHWE